MTPSQRRKKRRSFLNRTAPANGEIPLQITSMADIFTILLVFLLKGMATGSAQISPTAGIELPQAAGLGVMSETLQIEISESNVLVDHQPVLTLQKFGLPSDLGPLTQSLATQRERQNLISQNNREVAADARIVIIADQKVPHRTVRAILTEAALAGYTEPKLAVASRN